MAGVVGSMVRVEGTARAAAVDGAVQIEGLQPPETARQNAALLYFQAWQSVPQATLERVVNERADARVLVEHEALVGGLLRAAETEHCDWGLQYEQGLKALLPHVGLMRKTARIIAADAERLMKGEPKEAGEVSRRLGALVRMSNQLRGDRVLISTLVGIAINKLAGMTIDPWLDDGTLPIDTAQACLNAYRSLPKDDPFGVEAGITGERDWFIKWVRETYKGEQAGREFAEEMASFVDVTAAGPVATQRLEAMDEEDFGAELDRLAGYYQEAVEEWGKPDAREKLEALAEKVGKGEFGAAAPFLAPALGTVHASDKAGRDEIERMVNRLTRYIGEGGKPLKAPESGTGTGTGSGSGTGSGAGKSAK
jgi:hypothetical protein